MGPPAAPSLPFTAPHSGYTPAHATYEEDRKRAQVQAFVMHRGMVGRVEGRLVYLAPGTVKAQVLGVSLDLTPKQPLDPIL
jgi:hypothetical protein